MSSSDLIHPRWENRNDEGLAKEDILGKYFNLLDDQDIQALYKIYEDDFLNFGYQFKYKHFRFNVESWHLKCDHKSVIYLFYHIIYHCSSKTSNYIFLFYFLCFIPLKRGLKDFRAREGAQIMNPFFINKVNNPYQNLPQWPGEPLRFVHKLIENRTCSLKLTSNHPDDVLRIRSKLKKSSSFGSDEIGSCLLKH